MIDPSKLSKQEIELLQTYEQGRVLRELVRDPGWQVILDLMEKEVAKAEFQLINYNGTDKEVTFALQKRARAMREFFQQIQHAINARISEADEVPSILRESPVGDLGFTI